MPLIKQTAFLIPRSTSQLIVTAGYEKPLLQLRFNTGQGDRDKWVKELPALPAGLPPAAAAKELDCEAEMQRLAANYGPAMFRKVYPLDELFVRAFEACQTVTMPSQENAVPDMAPAPAMLIEDFVGLRVPTLDKAKATKLVEAGFQVDTIVNADVRSITALTGLSANLIRATIEAAKAHPAPVAPRGAPSAPSELRPTRVEAPMSA